MQIEVHLCNWTYVFVDFTITILVLACSGQVACVHSFERKHFKSQGRRLPMLVYKFHPTVNCLVLPELPLSFAK